MTVEIFENNVCSLKHCCAVTTYIVFMNSVYTFIYSENFGEGGESHQVLITKQEGPVLANDVIKSLEEREREREEKDGL